MKGHHLWAHFREIQHLSFQQSQESINQWNEYVKLAYEAQKNT
ncbi:MAG: hypothetical protein NZ551_10490 [Microscillaceae bacterium]|nr:hypothetical protein [Microscillaceae bacterium]MDW8461626.1 hypothetical protein [Cytophagales bacterium]